VSTGILFGQLLFPSTVN